MRSGAAILARAVTGSYLLLIGAWMLGRLVARDAWWPLVLLDKWGTWLLLAAWPVLVLAVATGRRWRIVAAAVPCLLFVQLHAPYLVPRPAPAVASSADGSPADEPTLRVMTYNVWNGNADLDRIAGAILGSGADVVAVQELVESRKAGLVERLETVYPHRFVSAPNRGGTTALFSRRPLGSVRALDFGIDRPAILADVTVAGAPVTVVSAHLNPSWYAYNERPIRTMPAAIERYVVDQREQVRQLIAVLRARSSERIVLACDCNVQKGSSTRSLLGSFFRDAAAATGWQRGEVPLPGTVHERGLLSIDCLWFRGPLAPRGVYRALDAGGSDHAPLFADFAPGVPRRRVPRRRATPGDVRRAARPAPARRARCPRAPAPRPTRARAATGGPPSPRT